VLHDVACVEEACKESVQKSRRMLACKKQKKNERKGNCSWSGETH
jgi:hypothetical protein